MAVVTFHSGNKCFQVKHLLINKKLGIVWGTCVGVS